MHELPVVKNLVEIVLQHAEMNRAERVVSITLEIGELSDLEDEWMQKYFNFVSRGTVAEEAELVIHRCPVVVQCSECNRRFEVSLEELPPDKCPACSNCEKFNVVKGKEFYIREMKVI